jgi:hypothetical protein
VARQFVPAANYTYADNNALDMLAQGTLAVWLQFVNTTTNGFPLIKDHNYTVYQNGANLEVHYKQSGSHPTGPNQAWGWARAIPSTGVWHHVALTVNGDEPDDLFINGVSVGTGPSFFGGGAASLTNPLFVGGAFGQNWNGAIAHFAMWSTVLSGSDITALQTTAPSSVGSPQAYISFEASVNEQIAGITPTSTGTINTVTGPTLGGGGGTIQQPTLKRMGGVPGMAGAKFYAGVGGGVW